VLLEYVAENGHIYRSIAVLMSMRHKPVSL